MFTAERQAKRAVYVADVAPVMNALAALRDVVEKRRGLGIITEGSQVFYVAAASQATGDFF
jgi:hypothetical protein